MGIIAGIAIPTTIAVINRQKRNAAAKSADSAVSTMKNLLLEYQASASTTSIVGEANYGSTATSTPTSFTIKDTASTPTTLTNDVNDMTIDNLKATGTLKITLNITQGTFTYEVTSFKIGDYTISINANGVCSAS